MHGSEEGEVFPYGFLPTVYRERFGDPAKVKKPAKIFVCSMGDLFGNWVDQYLIDEIIQIAKDTPRHTFIFLTKNPTRLIGIDWPPNAWVGATVDRQARAALAGDALAQTNATIRFVSCEPMLERIYLGYLKGTIDWLIIGAQSRTSGAPAFQPDPEWVASLLCWAGELGVPVFMKDNLQFRLREFPK